jgi:L-glyceraldehyde 3-phosphate reductase
VEIGRSLNTPILLNQPRYSILDRAVEESVLGAVGETGTGLIAFSPLAQGLLTDRYLTGEIPAGSRMAIGHFLKGSALSDERLAVLRSLNEVAAGRGQSLAQLALSWVLRGPRVVSVIIGASSIEQLDQNLAALRAGPLCDDDLKRIDELAG